VALSGCRKSDCAGKRENNDEPRDCDTRLHSPKIVQQKP
jgi:hypothetical protein